MDGMSSPLYLPSESIFLKEGWLFLKLSNDIVKSNIWLILFLFLFPTYRTAQLIMILVALWVWVFFNSDIKYEMAEGLEVRHLISKRHKEKLCFKFYTMVVLCERKRKIEKQRWKTKKPPQIKITLNHQTQQPINGENERKSNWSRS